MGSKGLSKIREDLRENLERHRSWQFKERNPVNGLVELSRHLRIPYNSYSVI